MSTAKRLFAVYGLDMGTSRRYRFVMRAASPGEASAKMEREGIRVVGVEPWWRVKARRYALRTVVVVAAAVSAFYILQMTG